MGNCYVIRGVYNDKYSTNQIEVGEYAKWGHSFALDFFDVTFEKLPYGGTNIIGPGQTLC